MSLRGWLSLVAVVAVVALVSAQEDCPPAAACQSSPGAVICSGRGDCVCGNCECYPHRQYISGRYCECDDRACDRYGGRLCGGPDHGVCTCGMCNCRPGWQGSACECPTSNSTCIEPGSDRVCSGTGLCVCGRCRCSGGSAGHYCEQCPTCRSKCGSYKACVECLAFDTGPLKGHCQSACSQVSIELEEDPQVSDAGGRLCSFYTGDCRYRFVYGAASSPVRVQRRPDCPPAAPAPPGGLWGSGGGGGSASRATLLLGLCTAIGWW